MNVAPISIYNCYMPSFYGRKETTTSQSKDIDIQNPNIQKALLLGEKMFAMSKDEINNFEFAKDLDITFVPLDCIDYDGIAACINFRTHIDEKSLEYDQFRMFIPKLKDDIKPSKISYIEHFIHEYQHYLSILNGENRYSNLHENLKKENIFSKNIYMSFINHSDSLKEYLEGDLMREGIMSMFGQEGKRTYEKQGIISIPKIINKDTVAQSFGFKDAQEFKEDFNKQIDFKELGTRIINNDKDFYYKWVHSPDRISGATDKILREYLKTSFLDEASSCYAEYLISEKYCFNDYGAKYMATYYKLIADALEE